jgi:hypothetical protein
MSKISRSRLPSWASATRPTSFVVALDDSGQKAVRPAAERRCFFLGGIILPSVNLESLRRAWVTQGQEETKARTYAASLELEGRPLWAEALLSVQMNHWEALPLWFSYDKGEAGPDVMLPTRRGGRRIDISKAMKFLAATLSTHLHHVRGKVESISVDHMASPHDEAIMQEQWQIARGQLGRAHRHALPKELIFVDSRASPEIQVADVLLGLIRASQEENRPMAPGLGRLLEKAEAQKLFGFHLS